MPRALSTIVLLGLLVATAAAFALTEHLKLMKSPIWDTRVTRVFSPVCQCATAKAEIGFKLRSPDTVTITIVGPSGQVATVKAGVPVAADTLVTYSWDGRTSAGTLARDGTYQPEIALTHRTILMPNKIVLDTVAPKVVSASDGDGLLIAGGHHVPIQYTFSGHARAAVYLGGTRVILGRSSKPSGQVKWNGIRLGKPLPPGRYVLEVAAVDSAGNETPPAERKQVVVRIEVIALDETSIRVAPGAHFTVGVRTGAPQYEWTFAEAHGTGKAKLLHLRAPAHRGRFRLVVSEAGQSTSAIVIVGGKT